jgi:hypothetical protein
MLEIRLLGQFSLRKDGVVKILATSREKLNLQSETNLNIGGSKMCSLPGVTIWIKKNALHLLKFIYGFWIVYWVRGWVRGAIELFADGVDALAQTGHDSNVRAVRAMALAFQGFFLSSTGLADEGYKPIKESIEILERLDHPIELAFAYNGLTLAAYYLNRPAEEKMPHIVF